MGKSSGSAPQPVDPYQQAAAQYGLSTGTAQYNAALNRTGSVNPLGSSQWSITGYSGGPGTATGGKPPVNPNGSVNPQVTGGNPLVPNNGGTFGFGGMAAGARSPGGTPYGFGGTGQGAPLYQQTTSLQPWANQMLSSPINTSGIAGMPGGPSTTQDLYNTQNALYNREMGYIAPEQQLKSEQLQSQLINQGLTPGSPGYNNEMDRLNREQTFQNQQAIDSAITGGGAEQSRLFGLGSQALQNQLSVRNAPISEYEALLGNGGAAQAAAQTPDISGAFNQAYQGKLAGYNAGVASDNNTTSTLGSLGSAALLAYFLA